MCQNMLISPSYNIPISTAISTNLKSTTSRSILPTDSTTSFTSVVPTIQ